MSDEDDQWVLVREAAQLLSAAAGFPVSQDSVRAYADSGHLKSRRPPSVGPGHSARRISTASIGALGAAMKMPPGQDQREAMTALRKRNAEQD